MNLLLMSNQIILRLSYFWCFFKAKPDYTYVYGVQDNDYGNSQAHKETRDGDNVRGEYKVLQPDGMIRIVRYIADPVGGFKATVDYMKAPNWPNLKTI